MDTHAEIQFEHLSDLAAAVGRINFQERYRPDDESDAFMNFEGAFDMLVTLADAQQTAALNDAYQVMSDAIANTTSTNEHCSIRLACVSNAARIIGLGE